jgi:hypothetical protein
MSHQPARFADNGDCEPPQPTVLVQEVVGFRRPLVFWASRSIPTSQSTKRTVQAARGTSFAQIKVIKP